LEEENDGFEIQGIISNVEIIMTSPNGCEKYPHKEMNELCNFSSAQKIYSYTN